MQTSITELRLTENICSETGELIDKLYSFVTDFNCTKKLQDSFMDSEDYRKLNEALKVLEDINSSALNYGNKISKKIIL